MLISLVYRSQLGGIMAKPFCWMNLAHHADATNVYSMMEGPGTMNAGISQILYLGGEGWESDASCTWKKITW